MSNKKNNVIALNGKAVAAVQEASTSRKPLVGKALLKALAVKAQENGHDRAAVAAALRVTTGYMLQLEGGLRYLNTISDDFAAACARYLGIPRLQVLRLAGRISAEDSFCSADAFQQDVERAVRFIEADGKWCTVLTAELRASSIDTLFQVVRLYEAATGRVLMTQCQEGESSKPSAKGKKKLAK